jgi:hypothetical protein
MCTSPLRCREIPFQEGGGASFLWLKMKNTLDHSGNIVDTTGDYPNSTRRWPHSWRWAGSPRGRHPPWRWGRTRPGRPPWSSAGFWRWGSLARSSAKASLFLLVASTGFSTHLSLLYFSYRMSRDILLASFPNVAFYLLIFLLHVKRIKWINLECRCTTNLYQLDITGKPACLYTS